MSLGTLVHIDSNGIKLLEDIIKHAISPLNIYDIFPCLKGLVWSQLMYDICYMFDRYKRKLTFEFVKIRRITKEECDTFTPDRKIIGLFNEILLNTESAQNNNIYENLPLLNLNTSKTYELLVENDGNFVISCSDEDSLYDVYCIFVNRIIHHSLIDPLLVSVCIRSFSGVNYYLNNDRSNLSTCYITCKEIDMKQIIGNRLFALLWLIKQIVIQDVYKYFMINKLL